MACNFIWKDFDYSSITAVGWGNSSSSIYSCSCLFQVWLTEQTSPTSCLSGKTACIDGDSFSPDLAGCSPAPTGGNQHSDLLSDGGYLLPHCRDPDSLGCDAQERDTVCFVNCCLTRTLRWDLMHYRWFINTCTYY